MTNPMTTYGRETGADVEAHVAGRRVGVQVTEYGADEGITEPGRGLRATESRDAAQQRFPARALPLQHQLTALRARINAKVIKARGYTFEEFDEVWLLVAASLARPDAMVSTFLISQLLAPDDLNRHLDEDLRGSKYTRAYLHIHIADTVYEWTRADGWRLVRGEARPAATGGELWFKSMLLPFPPSQQ